MYQSTKVRIKACIPLCTFVQVIFNLCLVCVNEIQKMNTCTGFVHVLCGTELISGKLSMKQIMAEFVWTNSLPDNWENTPVIIDLDVFGGVDEIKAYSIYLTKQTFIYK